METKHTEENGDEGLIKQLRKAEETIAEGEAVERRGAEEIAEGRRELKHIEEELARESRVIVNGRQRTIEGRVVSFEEAVKIAFPNGPSKPDVKYSVTYGNAVKPHRDGELDPGQKVTVKPGNNPNEETSFCVTETILS